MGESFKESTKEKEAKKRLKVDTEFVKLLAVAYWAVGQGVQRLLTEKHSADRKRKYCQNTSKIYSLSDIILQQNQKNSMQNLFLHRNQSFISKYCQFPEKSSVKGFQNRNYLY